MAKKVLVGGVFNVIHPGHIYFLKRAKKFGRLVVVVANTKTAKKVKKIVFPAKERAQLVASLKFVDKVRIGYWPPNWQRIIREERPDIIALGYDQKLKVKSKHFKNIKIVKIDKFKNYSTKRILKI
jgi:FAD synthetase